MSSRGPSLFDTPENCPTPWTRDESNYDGPINGKCLGYLYAILFDVRYGYWLGRVQLARAANSILDFEWRWRSGTPLALVGTLDANSVVISHIDTMELTTSETTDNGLTDKDAQFSCNLQKNDIVVFQQGDRDYITNEPSEFDRWEVDPFTGVSLPYYFSYTDRDRLLKATKSWKPKEYARKVCEILCVQMRTSTRKISPETHVSAILRAHKAVVRGGLQTSDELEFLVDSLKDYDATDLLGRSSEIWLYHYGTLVETLGDVYSDSTDKSERNDLGLLIIRDYISYELKPVRLDTEPRTKPLSPAEEQILHAIDALCLGAMQKNPKLI